MTRIQVYTDENAKQKAFQLRKKLQISNEVLQLKHPELFMNPKVTVLKPVEKAKVIDISLPQKKDRTEELLATHKPTDSKNRKQGTDWYIKTKILKAQIKIYHDLGITKDEFFALWD